MPILKHAKKKLKQDKKRTIKNKKIKETYKTLLKKAKEKNTPQTVGKAFSAVDKAAKKNILSKNKAARLKSSLSKNVSEKTVHSTKTVHTAKKAETASKKEATKPAAKTTKT